MEWFQDLKEARLLLKTSQMGRSFSNYVRTNFFFLFIGQGVVPISQAPPLVAQWEQEWSVELDQVWISMPKDILWGCFRTWPWPTLSSGLDLRLHYNLSIILTPSHKLTSLSKASLVAPNARRVGRGCLLWPVHFLGRTLLVFALLHSAFQGQICLLLQMFLDFLLLHSSSL